MVEFACIAVQGCRDAMFLNNNKSNDKVQSSKFCHDFATQES